MMYLISQLWWLLLIALLLGFVVGWTTAGRKSS